MPDELKIEIVQKVINDLEGVAEERIKAKVRFEHEIEVLQSLGCSTIDGAGKEIKNLDVKIEKRNNALLEEFNDFIEDYGETLE